jgi:uncharacterized protein YkwD/DNA-binding transcriptional regulator YhcF (GntR family)
MREIAEKNTIQILDESLKQGFTAIPRNILKAPNLTMQAKIIFALLLDYAWQKGSCFPGQDRLANDLGVHKNTIIKHLNELKDSGLISWKQRGLNRTNIYYINSLTTFGSKSIENTDDSLESHSSVIPESHPDVTQEIHPSVNIIEEVEYKKKEYKKPLTLSNDNERINLSLFDTEAITIAQELNDEKSIRYYQKIVNQKKKGEITDDDISTALNDTRRMIRTDQVDGKSFLRNPAGWFVSVLQKLTSKRKEKEQKTKVDSLLKDFHKSFASKSLVVLLVFICFGFQLAVPVKAQDNTEITIESVYEAHNKIRKENNLPDLTLNEELTKSAYLKGVSMMFQNCWSHYCPDSPWGDFQLVGYQYDFAGENLAHGFTSNDNLMKAWMNSPLHKANILSSNYSEIGIAVIKGKYLTSPQDTIVVVHFGKPQDTTIKNEFSLFSSNLFLKDRLCWSNY